MCRFKLLADFMGSPHSLRTFPKFKVHPTNSDHVCTLPISAHTARGSGLPNHNRRHDHQACRYEAGTDQMYVWRRGERMRLLLLLLYSHVDGTFALKNVVMAARLWMDDERFLYDEESL